MRLDEELELGGIRLGVVDVRPAALRPVLATPLHADVDLPAWTRDHRGFVDTLLDDNGVLILRGFGCGVSEYQRFCDAVCPSRFAYDYRSTPREAVGEHTYLATTYPPSSKIPLHIECAYDRVWPRRIAVFCEVAARSGGATSMADTRAITRSIPRGVLESFARHGVLYVRNIRPHVDLPWQTVFQTTSKLDVERACDRAGIEHEWVGDDTLRTRHVCQGLAEHPGTGRAVWCNQAHLFHPTSLDPAFIDVLREDYGDRGLPRDARFGDDSPIPTSALQAIRRAYDAQEVNLPWQTGDVAVFDNMLVHHGRTPFEGARRVLVTLGGTFQGTHYPRLPSGSH